MSKNKNEKTKKSNQKIKAAPGSGGQNTPWPGEGLHKPGVIDDGKEKTIIPLVR